jgi:hypothetical protein
LNTDFAECPEDLTAYYSSNSFISSGDRNSMAVSQGNIENPRQIDVHLKIFGKEPWEVDYDLHGYCAICLEDNDTTLIFISA